MKQALRFLLALHLVFAEVSFAQQTSVGGKAAIGGVASGGASFVTPHSFVQGCFSPGNAGTGVANLSCTFTNNITAGNTVIVMGRTCCTTSIATTAQDGPGDTFTLPANASATFHTIASPIYKGWVYIALNSAGGSKTVQANFSPNATFSSMAAAEISGTSVVDNCQQIVADAPVSPPSVNVTTALNGEYIADVVYVQSSAGINSTSGVFTLRVNDVGDAGNNGAFYLDATIATAGTTAVTFSGTGPSGADTVVFGCALK